MAARIKVNGIVRGYTPGRQTQWLKVQQSLHFNPSLARRRKIYVKYCEQFGAEVPLIRVEPTHKEFILPITMSDIKAALKSVPEQFLTGLKAVLVPSGSKKQIASMKGRFMHGQYWQSCIVLHRPRVAIGIVLKQSLEREAASGIGAEPGKINP